MFLEKLNQALDVLSALRNEGRVGGFTLIGGLAVSAWSPPRATMDVDLMVLVESGNLNYLVRALRDSGIDAELLRGGSDDPVPCLIRAELLDIIVATKKYEAEAIAHSIVINIGGRDIPVTSPEYLIILKMKAGGPRDLLDVRELLSSGLVDLELLASLASKHHIDLSVAGG